MSHNMVNFGPLAAEIGFQQISMGFVCWLRYCTDVAHRRPTKLCTIFDRLLELYIIYTFSGALAPLTEFCHVQNSLCIQVLRSSILAASLRAVLGTEQRTSAKLCGVVQGMELGNFRRGRHLYSPGRPPRLASADILV